MPAATSTGAVGMPAVPRPGSKSSGGMPSKIDSWLLACRSWIFSCGTWDSVCDRLLWAWSTSSSVIAPPLKRAWAMTRVLRWRSTLASVSLICACSVRICT